MNISIFCRHWQILPGVWAHNAASDNTLGYGDAWWKDAEKQAMCLVWNMRRPWTVSALGQWVGAAGWTWTAPDKWYNVLFEWLSECVCIMLQLVKCSNTAGSSSCSKLVGEAEKDDWGSGSKLGSDCWPGSQLPTPMQLLQSKVMGWHGPMEKPHGIPILGNHEHPWTSMNHVIPCPWDMRYGRYMLILRNSHRNIYVYTYSTL